MVYVRLNENLQARIPKKHLQEVEVLAIEQSKYIKYIEFKKISKLSNQQLYKFVCKSDIVSEIDINRLLQLSKRTPQEKKMIQQLKNKHEYRLMSTPTSTRGNNMNCQSYYYGNAGQQQGSNSVKELTDSMSFGVTFIFSFFMAGVTGYFFAQYFFHFQLTGCLMVSVVFIFVTIFVETWLYIIKQSKANHKLEKERKQWQKKQSLKAQYSLRSKFKYKADPVPGAKEKKE